MLRRLPLVVCALATLTLIRLDAQTRPAQSTSDRSTRSAAIPIRRVVLYKNGVGYFEHVGRVHGSETVAIDFNSSQLNDVLKSLTAIDLGSGRVRGISYNSDAPFAERLRTLPLPLADYTPLLELLEALRGARVEVASNGRSIAGRVFGVEARVTDRDNRATTINVLTIVTDAGEIKAVELTPTLSVR